MRLIWLCLMCFYWRWPANNSLWSDFLLNLWILLNFLIHPLEMSTDMLIVFLCVFLYSQWDHQERSIKHLRPQPRVVSRQWHRKQNKRETPNKTDSMLCTLGLQHARCSKSKFKENKCKCIVQMTRVQRVPCLPCVMPLPWNYQRNKPQLTYF